MRRVVQFLSLLGALFSLALVRSQETPYENDAALLSRPLVETLPLPMEDVRWGALKNNEQILFSLQRDFSHRAQETLKQRIEELGGEFLHYVPERSLLFLGGPELLESAQKLPYVTSAAVYPASSKISPEWESVFEVLDQHPVSAVAERPLHELLKKTSGHSLFGQLLIDQTRSGKRLVMEVGFPVVESSADMPPAQAAAEDWLEPLRSRFGSEIDLIPYHGLLDVYVPPSVVPQVVELLSQQSPVHWIQPRTPLQLHNWRASSIIQSGLAADIESADIDPRLHPIWTAGLRGEGQVVGCGDSGVDVESCYFHDPDVSFFDNTVRLASYNIHSVFESDTHRKIVYYGSSADLEDGDGHGTHVAGSLVGRPLDDRDEVAAASRGMAPEAKLAFLDLGERLNGSDSDSIFTPRELSTYYYPLTYDHGARVHSDSWGSESPAYDHLAQEVDRFVWNHQDFLPVFAAGNYGQFSRRFLTTVTSPAVAKNCLSVGATLTAHQRSSFVNSAIRAYLIEIRSTFPEEAEEIRQYKILGATFGSSWEDLIDETADHEVELVRGDPADGCTTLGNGARGKVILIDRGHCSFMQKLTNAQARGAVAVIVANHLNHGYFAMDADDNTPNSELTIPIAAVPLSIGQQLKEGIRSGRRTTVRVMDRTEPQNAYDNIADFSSSGPTTDYRIKPDIVAPGQIKSVWSSAGYDSAPGECHLRTSAGTSMATPVVAGAALLVRQFFTDGYYPSGEKRLRHSHHPSGALMKATLLGGAFAMDGYTEAGLPLEPPPSPRQGFGRVHLQTSLPVRGSAKWKKGWRIQVVDGANLTTGQSHEYCVQALGGPIRVTLVWTDPPATPGAQTFLVNDLDLSVRSAGLKGRELLGNGELDRRNNVERVSVEDMPNGNLAIVVKGHSVVTSFGPQPYALVVQGVFNGILRSVHNPYQSGATSEEKCIITLAVMKSGPEGPTNESSPEFRFGTQSGVQPVNGFECRLTEIRRVTSEETQPVMVHDWRKCSSPAQYQNLTDQAYVFAVRPRNEELEVRREFVVDTRAPVVEILEEPIAPISASEAAEFRFGATDLTSVTYRCALRLQGHRRDVRIARVKTGETDLQLNDWFPCASPEEFRGFTHGNWTFSIRAEDEAGNIQEEATLWTWRTLFAENEYYVRTLEAPPPNSASVNSAFRLRVITGNETGAAVKLTDEPVECRLLSVTHSNPESTPFQPCGLRPEFVGLADDKYVFQARTQDPRGYNPESTANVEFSVDSTPPVVSFSQRPGPFHRSENVALKYSASEEVRSYSCSMRPSEAPKRFNQCPGKEAETANYQLKDGRYTFQAKALDLAGNEGFSENVTFFVDSVPPQILFEAPIPFATNQSRVEVEFEVTDKGSGVVDQNTTCSLLNEASEERLELTSESCVSPLAWTLEEGRYLFTLRATDRAGHISEKDLPIIVDFTPPTAEMEQTPAANKAQPSFVVFKFGGADNPKDKASLVERFECRLTRSRRNRTTVEALRVEVSESGRRRVLHLDRILRSRHLMQGNSSADDDDRIRIRDGSRIRLRLWVECESPVILEQMSSGAYRFQVRAVDHAGNAGEPTAASLFTVDDTLPIPGQETESEDSDPLDLTQEFAVKLAIAGSVFVVCLCVVVGCWRRRSRQRFLQRQREERARYTAGQFAPQSDAHSSTSSNDPMLAAAMRASVSAQRFEAERRRREMEEALDAERVRQALQESMDDYQYQTALKRSLNGRFDGGLRSGEVCGADS